MKGELKMARLNINISEKLNKEMREYIENNNMSITTFLHLAMTHYLTYQQDLEKARKWYENINPSNKGELKK